MGERQLSRTARSSGARRAAARRGSPATSRGQSGYTLIEVLIAVFLVGTVVAALAAGMLTMMSATRSTTEQQRLEAAVLSYTELLRSQAYVDCAGTGTYPTFDDGNGITGRVDAVRYWAVASGGAWGAEPFATNCATDLGRQLVDVVVQLGAGGPDTTAQVVLRRDA